MSVPIKADAWPEDSGFVYFVVGYVVVGANRASKQPAGTSLVR